MQRFFAIFSIVLLLFVQAVPAVSLAEGTINEDSNLFEVSAKEGSTQEMTTIGLKSLSSEYDRLVVELSESSVYNEEMTKALGQEAIKFTYEAQAHSIEIEWNEGAKQEANFVLVDLHSTENQLTIQGIVADEVVVEEKHTFKVSEINAEISEEERKETNEEEKQEGNEETNVEEMQEGNEETKETDTQEGREEVQVEEKQENKVEVKKAETTNNNNIRNITSFAGDLNTDINISPVNNTILSGENALYKLTLKLTGSKRVYRDVELVVDLPVSEHVTFDESNIASLEMNGVTPNYNNETHELTYFFDEITRGQTYEKIIKLQTENGYILSGEEATVTASVAGNTHNTENDNAENPADAEITTFEFEDDATVRIESTSGVSIVKTIASPSGEVATHGANVDWKIEVLIPKGDKGQLFLKPGETIIITDQLPDAFTFNEMVEGDPYTSIEDNLVTWEFTADDFAEQEESEDELFSKSLIFRTTVGPSAPNDYIENTANVAATFIDDVTLENSADKSVYIAISQPGAGTIEGTIPIPVHLGPSNGDGGLGNNDDKNPDPLVTDDALLKFSHGIGPLRESAPSTEFLGDGRIVVGNSYIDFQAYTTVYEIDPNLNLETIKVPNGFHFKPVGPVDGVPFLNQPEYEILAIVNGTEQTLVVAEDVVDNRIYTREELGLSSSDRVSEIRFNFTYAPAGIQSKSRVEFEFSVQPGYVGKVENHFNIIGRDGLGQDFSAKERYTNNFTLGHNNDIAGPRQATIIPYPAEPEPVGEVGVRLLDHVGGHVTPGPNRMQLNLSNVNNSLAPMNEPLESIVLLPPGVQLSVDANASYTDAQGNDTNNATYEVLTDDYNGSGRQLIKVGWDDSRIIKGQEVTAELDVVIAENAPSNLTFDIYGFSSDSRLQAPTYEDYIITNTILQTDEEDLNGDGVTDQPRLKSANMYTMTGDYDLQTEKLIKGPNDDDFSKFTFAPFDGTVEYKLKMTNTTGKDLSTMTLIDVLPTIGDLGITDNIGRGSTFEPVLEGPITIPADWEGKVDVFYSTAKNPERDDLTSSTDYPDTTTPLTNPEGAEVPNWVTVEEVTDWNSIHSFKIELAPGSTWIKGQDIEIDFSMQMPSENDVAEDVINLDLAPQQRAAWNSFAVATDQGQPVEPERVGVALELDPPETPDIEKEVEDNDGEFVKDLVEKAREQEYKYNVNTVIPENLAGYEYLTLADELDGRLDVIGAVALVDGEEVDYEVTIEDQLVTLQLDRDRLNDIAGQRLTLQITAQIKEGVEVEVIDNQATIQVNENPRKESNIVPVIPPPETPDIEKEVEDNDGEFVKDLVEKAREQEYKYNVNTVIPENLAGYEYLTLADELDERLDVIGAVALVDGEEVDYEVTIEDQLVTLQLDRDQLNDIAAQRVTLQITAQIKEGVEVEVIDNQATIQVNENPRKESNIVPVTPVDPPRTPEIDKDVEGKDHLDVDYDKEYKYNVITKLPNKIEAYEKFVITDTVDAGLVVIGDKVKATVDGEAIDGLELTVDGNNVKVEVTDFTGLEGKGQIELVILAKIHPDTDMANYVDNKIPNTASLDFINELGVAGELVTEPVTVTPPPISEDSGSKLPSTATNIFTLQLIGFALILVGLVAFIIRRKHA